MAFNRPALADLRRRIQADFVSRLELKGGILRRSVVGVLSTVLAGCSHIWHGHLDWLSNQILTTTMDEDFLLREAPLYGIYRKDASAASGFVSFSGESGAVVPSGTTLKRASDGALFTTTADGLASVPVTAQEAGAAGNTDAGAVLSLITPISGVVSSATVGDGGITGGSDIEDVESLRARVIARKQQPPMGGSLSDYVTWALEVAGVTRAWAYRNWQGVGTVGVTFVRDDDTPIIPDSAEVETVQEYIEEKRPVTADVFVFAPTAKNIDFTIAVSPNTVAVRNAVLSEMQAFFTRDAEPGGTVYLSRVSEAISSALSEIHHKIIGPADDVTCEPTELPMLGEVTFQDAD